MISPAHAVPPCISVKDAHPPRHGSNLGQPGNGYWLAHFSFQTPDNIGAHVSNPHEPAFPFALAVSGADPAVNRRHSPAESGPFPFSQINHVAHSGFLSSLSRKHELMESGYAKKHKTLWHNGG